MKPVLLFDRDGTMGDGPRGMPTPWDYQEFPFTKAVFSELKAHGFPLYVVTNQSCIARGLAKGYDFGEEMRQVGADDYFICPHDTNDNCNCRKPKPGLLQTASEKHGFDLKESFMIGDRWSDMVAGGQCGCHLILVLTGRGKEALMEDRCKWEKYTADYIASNLKSAAEWLIAHYN